MKKIMFKRSISLLAAVLLLVGASGASSAQQSPGNFGNGIRVSPVRTDLVMNPGETRQVNVTVSNLTAASSEYQAYVNDFVAADGELGQPALILDNDKYAPSHSLKRFMQNVPNVTVGAGQSKDVKVTISVPRDAAAGGYYGAVRFAPAKSGDESKNVTLAASVGSLILVKVPGDIKENVTLDTFDVRRGTGNKAGSSFFTTNKNLYAVARFNNSGNVHEQPFGKVQLKKGGKVIETLEINNTDPRGNVLPDSVRRFESKLNKVGFWGKYEVEGNFGYGTNGQLLSAKSTFYVFPLILILIGLGLLALVLFLIFGLPKVVRNYNRSVVRKANRRR